MRNNFPVKLTAPQKYDPKWVAYAKAHGQTPAGMILRDKRKFPKDMMKGYSTWAMIQWNKWVKECNFPENLELSDEHIENFSVWLTKEQ